MSHLTDWTVHHDTLAELARALFRAALTGDPRVGRVALAELSAPLRLHMDQEERTLLPAYEALPPPAPNLAGPVLRRDHERLRSLRDALEEHLGATTVEGVLAEQDALIALQGVLEHHDLRERAGMLTVLDATVPAEERAAWVEGFVAEEAALSEPVAPPAPRRVRHPAPGDAAGPSPHQAPPPVTGDPLVHARLAVARDVNVARALAAVPVPDHPKGPRLHRRCAEALAAAERSPDRQTRRDHLVDLAERLRLLTLAAHATTSRA